MPDHRSPEVQAQRSRAKAFGPLVLLLLAPIWLPLALAGVIFHFSFRAYLYLAVWLFWCARGIHVILVYSRSPHWQSHIENELIPKLPARTIVLNYSDRKAWPRWSLGAQVFRHFLGDREHTPSVIVFRPFNRVRIFRLFKAFREAKHGNQERLQQIEGELLGLNIRGQTTV